MQIYYWCPYLTNVATINAVKRSAISLIKYSKKKIDVSILNSSGEWSFLKNNIFGIKIINLIKFSYHKYLPKEGLISSRFSFILIFILNFFPLLFLIKKNKPNYLIIQLLTLLPIILSPLLSKKTKIILRISGLPEMTFFRKIIWKYFSKNIYLVTTPTKLTMENLVKNNIFDKNKIKILRDPIVSVREINKKKKEKVDENFNDNEFYVSIGRLTDQKNFEFLIDVFSKNIEKFKVKKLYIIGEGEKFNLLKKKIYEYKMQNNIFLIGFKNNIYNILNYSSGLISTARFEDPGFTLIESAFLRKTVISSLVKNGPMEMNNFGETGFFFEKNNENDFVKKILDNENSNKFEKIKNAFKYSKNFSIFEHYKELKKIVI